jgi:hypothetical protein
MASRFSVMVRRFASGMANCAAEIAKPLAQMASNPAREACAQGIMSSNGDHNSRAAQQITQSARVLHIHGLLNNKASRHPGIEGKASDL